MAHCIAASACSSCAHSRFQRELCVLAGMCLVLLVSSRPSRPRLPKPTTTRARSASTRCPIPWSDRRRRESDRPRHGTPRRRPEIMRLFETYVYGKMPIPPQPIKPVFRSARKTGRPWVARRFAGRWRSSSPTIRPARGSTSCSICPGRRGGPSRAGLPGLELRG